jgi:hypothetical protein
VGGNLLADQLGGDVELLLLREGRDGIDDTAKVSTLSGQERVTPKQRADLGTGAGPWRHGGAADEEVSSGSPTPIAGFDGGCLRSGGSEGAIGARG